MAGEAYGGAVVIQIAALVLVEGVFLSSWLLLDMDKVAPTPIRAAYGIMTFVMFSVLIVAGYAHGEGAAGLLFRIALGLAVGLSLYKAGVLELLRLRRKETRGPEHSRAYKRRKRRLELAMALNELELDMCSLERLSTTNMHARRMKTLPLNGAMKKKGKAAKKQGARI